MQVKEIVGIDVSKLTLDCHVHSSKVSDVFKNDFEGIASLVSWSLSNSDASSGDILFVFEHTGIYSDQLIAYLSGEGYYYHVAPGLAIKRSLGVIRGKSDRADARRIALYGHRLREELEPTRVSCKTLRSLKRLMSLRGKLVVQRAGHRACMGEQFRLLDKTEEQVLYNSQRTTIESLDRVISDIERELDRLIASDTELQGMYKLITGIKGIGAVTARFLIVYTMGFTKFDTWRKFASYCGIAPFPNQSGTSVKGRARLSNLANKEGKTLLSLCASSAIQYNMEMKQYYERRVSEGKNRMSTLNIIRNKLLARAFAVVNRGTPYVDVMKFAS